MAVEYFIDPEVLVGRWFPLFTQDEFETNLNQGCPIGINLDYPVEFRHALTAASVAGTFGYSAIDYVLKKYDPAYEFDPGGSDRRDREIRHQCISGVSSVIKGIQALRSNSADSGTIGEYLSDLTLGRIPYSLNRAFAEADKGALFESLVIARMIVEQLCWSLAVREHDDPSVIRSVSATKSISPVVGQFPTLGRLNGWLSKHAHWSFDAHVKAAFDNPGQVMMASSRFKCCAYVALGILATLTRDLITSSLTDSIDSEVVESEDRRMKFRGLERVRSEVAEIAKVVICLYPDVAQIFPKTPA